MVSTRDIVLGTLCCLAVFCLWWYGASDSRANEDLKHTRAKGLYGRGMGLSPDGSYDPNVALGLPAGIRIDPVTGELVGLSLEGDDGAKSLSWEVLRDYKYQAGLEDVPESVQKFDGQKVVMVGFLMATFEYEDIREFHLVASHWSCCYGIPPGLDGVIYVKLEDGASGLRQTLQPVKVVGTLKVEEIKESGVVWAIYALRDAKAEELKWN